MFARNKTEVAQTDIVMTLTPHVISRPGLTEEDLRSFLVGGSDSSSVIFEPPTVPPFQTPPKPSPEPPKAEPIRPPVQPNPGTPGS
jgi:hypothetical protein